ncbi:membrane protein [Azorhizobium oxalatiphilum]|uniref:Membrane protein n=1 Tax=Azorhizobium oxalatiphilum TaxID=980631 RepID=A0A917C842_9HYPH|nr:HPP family protein [Azorhizobium oxalatiphilum]GGF76923.1 membrane protein [Azorhizobium oxalatiphilum]
MAALFRHFLPAVGPVSRTEQVRAGVGALIGLFLTALVTRLALGADTAVPLLIAPMGASSVLLFAVPASPLAQPWSMLGGNLVASLAGVTAALLIHDPFLAGAAGVGSAITLMLAFRCVHPPSGAVALTAALGGPAVTSLGYGFVLWPVGVNSLILLVLAVAYNNLTRRPYPATLAARPAASPPEPQSARLGFSHEDVVAALREYDQVMDIDPAALEDVVQRAQVRAFDRRSGGLTCADIMTRHVPAVSPDTPILDALDLLRSGRTKVLPVTNDVAGVVGVLTQTDLLDKVNWDRKGPRLGLGRRMRAALHAGRAPDGVVREIMSTPVQAVTAETRIAALVPLMSSSGLHHIPVVDANGQLAGIVSQAELIAVLVEGRGAADQQVLAS